MKHPFNIMRAGQQTLLWVFLLLFFFSNQSYAEWDFLPESHHQLYDAWGLFIDEQASLLGYGDARLWTGLGGTIPVFGDNDSPHHTELVVHASANAGLHYNDNFRIWTETLDVRLGFAVEWEYDPNLRFSIGLTHYSAHTADGLNVADSNLIEPSVGEEFIPIRAVYDIDKKFRLAATLMPFIRSYPSTQPIWLNQSVEFYPWGAQDSNHRFSPYAAFSLEESGMKGYSYVVTYHAQLGAYIGNHFGKEHRQSIRAVVGYYNGADPRLKYFELRSDTEQFGYLGAMFDL